MAREVLHLGYCRFCGSGDVRKWVDRTVDPRWIFLLCQNPECRRVEQVG